MAPTTPAKAPPSWEELQPRLERLARLLDSAVRIPGTRIRIGADALIGLIPGVGDVAGLMLGLWLLWQARSLGAPGRLQGQMIGNLVLETVLGSVPLVGDLFDIAWRANQRNLALLRDWAEPPEPPAAASAPGRRLWPLAVLLVVAGLLAWQLGT